MEKSGFQPGMKWRTITFVSLTILISIPFAIYILAYQTDIIVFEKYGHLLSNRVVWSVETDEKVVALTFDDGPHEKYTSELLDTLANYDVKATFFLIGKNVEKHPEIVKRMQNEGHEIANHSYDHRILPFYGRREIRRQIDSTASLIDDAAGVIPKYFRPPMGLFTSKVLDVIKENGHIAVIGEVYPRDPYKPGVDKIVERVLSRTKPGSIIIMHDGGSWGKIDRSQSVAAVPIIIKSLREIGYRFVTVSELLSFNHGSGDSDPN